MSMLPMMGWKTALNYNIASQNPDYYTSMGLTAEQVAQKYDISREEQDEFAYNSHMRALNAIKEGKFKDEIVPVEVEEIFVDEKGKNRRKLSQ